jgi:hypothetical protein
MTYPVLGHPVRTKQPAEVVTIPFSFRSKLPPGVGLTGVPTVIVPPGLTLVQVAVADPVVHVQVSGGQLGETYQVSCLIGCTNGDVRELDVLIRVADEN